MEKTLSPEEKIRRAEEIYYKRKFQNENYDYGKESELNKKKKNKMFKKTIIRVIICFVLYFSVYLIKNDNSILSNNIMNKLNEMLLYDIDATKMANEFRNTLDKLKNKINEKMEINPEDDNIDLEGKEERNIIETNENNNLENENTNELVSNTIEPATQMELDAKEILNTKSLIIPLKGTITSRFGQRDSENPIVSKNHTGIDIAVNEGTVFIASMSGVVEEISNIRGSWKSYYNSK